MVKQKKFQFITLMLTLLISTVEAKSFKGLVKQKLFSSQGRSLCDGDLYQAKGQVSNLMNSVAQDVKKVPNDRWTLSKDMRWSNGYVSTKTYRGGDEIFSQMADLIRNAEHEVLVQTFIFDIFSKGAKMLFKAISDLEEKRKKMGAKKPVVVRFIFDIIGSAKGVNFFELMIGGRGGGRKGGSLSDGELKGRELGNYQLDFPRKLDPKYVRLEFKGHRHGEMLAVSHSKTAIIDRKVSVVTGANIVGYHHAKEVGTGKDEELMVDHGFLVYGPIALSMADEFYNLWHKNAGTKAGFSSQYNGNVDSDKAYPYDKKPFVNLKGFPKVYGVETTSWVKSPYMGVVGKQTGAMHRIAGKLNSWVNKLKWRAKVLAMQGENPQNAAFLGVFKHAKSHININTPSLNSWGFMHGILEALSRGVDVNIVVSKNYQDYNGPIQEAGKNSQAVKSLLKERKKLIKQFGGDESKVGDLTVKWFVTRGGQISGHRKGARVEKRIVVNEKFWNHNHTKFLVADNQVVIVGSANLDEQSWYNSREVNVILDSHRAASKLCKRVFKNDFDRAMAYGSKKWPGEKCWTNKQCDTGRCMNKVGRSWKCIFKDGTGLKGGYCEKNKQCKSNICNAKTAQCS